MLNDDSHLSVLRRKAAAVFNNRQMFALQKVYEWRDRIARIEDESTGYAQLYFYAHD